jgi:7,8-dihydropterin-6-yl-methyl-4-(beta-D-ribofuranosyl)aminobenzene 5'-phosphate synthase
MLLGVLASCQGTPSNSGNLLSKAESGPLQPSSSPFPSPSPTELPAASPVVEPTVSRKEEMVTITIIYDNYSFRPDLGTSWGFAALVEHHDQLLLFDTGGSGALLLSNLAALGFEPQDIEKVVLSHEHNDHIGGLQSLLTAGAQPEVYIPPSFSASFKQRYQGQAQLTNSRPGLQVAEGIYTIGEMPGPPPEQALVIDTSQGLVVITGCAHPGIDTVIREVKRQYKGEIYLVLGGFHLGSASDAQVRAIIQEFRRLGVKYAAPCHCTGDRAIGLFRSAFGKDFLPVGVGAVIEIGAH